MKKKPVLIIGGITLTVAVVGGALAMWRSVVTRNAAPPAHVALVRDRSDSSGCGCDALTAQAGEVLESPVFTSGSTLIVTETGAPRTANEPVVLGRYDIPANRGSLESQSKYLQRRQAILDDIKKRCEEESVTDKSPIFLAVRRAVEHLSAAGCDGRANCLLIVFSDLEELGERSIKEAISQGSGDSRNAPSRRTSPASAQLPAPIDNSAFDVVLAGSAETLGTTDDGGKGKPRVLSPARTQRRAEQIRQVWGSLFTDPRRVLFEPHCFTKLTARK